MTMKTRDLIHALLILADRHDADAKSPFNTDWSAVCREVANHLEGLQHELDETQAELAAWVKWYDEYDVELIKKSEVKEEVKELQIITNPAIVERTDTTPQEEIEDEKDE